MQTITYHLVSTERKGGGVHGTFLKSFNIKIGNCTASKFGFCMKSFGGIYVIKDKAVGMSIRLIEWERLCNL